MSNPKQISIRVLGWILHGFGVLFLLLLAMRIYEEVRYGHLRPPKEVRNIQEFRRWNPSFSAAEIVSFRGSTYYAVRGPAARLVASGPSEYYFDHNGNYVGRNIDIGDFYEPAIFSAREAQRRSTDIESIPQATVH